MNYLLTCSAALLLLVLAAPVSCQECPCQLSSSTTFQGMFTWDCTQLALTEVPGDCIAIRSENVSEFLLSYNKVTEIRSTTLAELTDLRVLRMDNNIIEFLDPTALEFMRDLEIFNIDHNLQLSIDYDSFAGLTQLKEISIIGSSQLTLPNLAVSPLQNSVDVRSSKLTSLPLHQLLHTNLTSTSFYLNLHGNEILDIAGSTLVELPDDTILNLDTFVTIWAHTEEERQIIIYKPWTVNIDLVTSTKVCELQGLPGDLEICFG